MAFKNIIKWQYLILFLAIAFCLQYILIAKLLPVFYIFSAGEKNPDQLFWYTGTYIEKLYRTLGENGRLFYRNMLLVDFLYAGFAAAGYSILLYFSSKNTKWTWASFTPVAMTFFDYLENISQIILLNTYPGVNAVLVFLSSVFSMLKMCFGGIGICLMIIFLLRLASLGVKKIYAVKKAE
jgi:hypothetical protein